jgi:hypothetical protein
MAERKVINGFIVERQQDGRIVTIGPAQTAQSGNAAPAPAAAPSVVLPRSMTTDIQNKGRLADTTGQDISNKVDAAKAPAVVDSAFANAYKTKLEAGEIERRAGQMGLTPDQYAGYRDQFLQLPRMQSILENLQVRNKRDFQGMNPLEYLPLAPNTSFDAVSQGLYGPVKAAQGLTSGELNAAAEQKTQIGLLLPSASDSDATREAKLQRLEKDLRDGIAKGRTYGFRWPTTYAFEVDDPNKMLSPETEQAVADTLFDPKLSAADAAKKIYGIASPGVKPSEEDIANTVGYVERVREEMSKDGALWGGIIYRVPEAVKNDKPAPSMTDNFLSGVGDIVKGLGDTVGIVNNPLNATVNAVLGTNLSTDLGTDLREATGLPNISSPIARAINEGGSSGFGMGVLAKGGTKVATGLTKEALKRLSATPLTDTFTGATANTAAELVRQQGGGGVAQTTAALIAGVPAYGLGRATNRIVNPGEKTAVANAAERQGILTMPADVAGPFTRRVTGAAAQLPFSAAPILESAEASVKSAERAVNRNVDNLGGVLSEVEAGNLVTKTGENVQSAKILKADEMIKDVNAKAQGVAIAPTSALKVVDDEIDRLNRNPETNAAAIAELEKYRSDIAGGSVLQGIRDLKTSLNSKSYNGNIRSTVEQGRNKRIAEALDADIETSLAAAPEALDAYKSFNKFYTERAGVLDQFDSLLGTGKSGEVLLKDIESLGRGNKGGVEMLRTVLGEMKPVEANQMRATVIDRLGRQQNNSDFSANTFFTNYGEKMTDDAKDAMFGTDGLRRNLDEIATVAKEMKAAGRFANFSNSGGSVALGNLGVLSTPVLADFFMKGADGAADSLVEGLVGALVLGGTQFTAGKLLASPKFASWLARAPKSNDPLAIRNYTTKLTAIAAAQPELAPDIEAYQQTVMDATGKIKPKGALAE